MKIENPRTIGKTLYLTAVPERGDPDATVTCNGCFLQSNGCGSENTTDGKILARVDLSSMGVKHLINSDSTVNCEATWEIKSRA